MNPRKAAKHTAPADLITSVRLTPELIARADALVPVLNRDPLVTAIAPVSRASILRLAIVEGLTVLESKYGKDATR